VLVFKEEQAEAKVIQHLGAVEQPRPRSPRGNLAVDVVHRAADDAHAAGREARSRFTDETHDHIVGDL
jgi:hypothetical protein